MCGAKSTTCIRPAGMWTRDVSSVAYCQSAVTVVAGCVLAFPGLYCIVRTLRAGGEPSGWPYLVLGLGFAILLLGAICCLVVHHKHRHQTRHTRHHTMDKQPTQTSHRDPETPPPAYEGLDVPPLAPCTVQDGPPPPYQHYRLYPKVDR